MLIELLIASQEEGNHHLLDLAVEYADVRENLALVSLQPGFGVNFQNRTGDSPIDNFEVIKQVELFRSAEAKEEAIRLADQGDYEGSHWALKNQI